MRFSAARSFAPSTRLAIGLIAGLAVAGTVVALYGTGLATGALGLIVPAALFVLIPTARRLSLRLAINGALVLGALPLVWWVALPSFGHIGRVAVLTALLAGALAAIALLSDRARSRMLPSLRVVDAIPVASVPALAWFFWPYVANAGSSRSLAMTIFEGGNDLVAHANMVAMIREMGVFGVQWSPSPDGSPFVYDIYPQHFHGLVAIFAEAWHGAVLASPEIELGLFGIGSGLAISVALISLIAAVVSLRPLDGRFWLALVAVAGTVSVVLLDLGGTTLIYGHPGFLLAVVALLLGVALASRPGSTSNIDLVAAGSVLVAVAHSWALLAPLAAVTFALVLIRLPWRMLNARRSRLIVPIVIVVVTSACVALALVLVVLMTWSAGVDNVLATPGGIDMPFLPFTVAIVLAVVGIVVAVLGSGTARLSREIRNPWVPILAVTVIGALVALTLVIVQLRRIDALSYFQYKFINGLTMLVMVELVVTLVVLAAIHVRRPEARRARTAAVAGAALVSLALGTFAGFPFTVHPSLRDSRLPGVEFRQDLVERAGMLSPGIERLNSASKLMIASDCPAVFYLAAAPGDLRPDLAGQWSMSLARRWTETTAPINSVLFNAWAKGGELPVADLLDELLGGNDELCVVLDRTVLESLPDRTTDRYGDRIAVLG